LLLAAPMSGNGKTTLTAGLIAALAAWGLTVAPFKCGPDYIDPSYLALAAGRPCHDLDSWLVPPEQIAGILARRSASADLALIEGVMGLFDGYSGDDDAGNSAQIRPPHGDARRAGARCPCDGPHRRPYRRPARLRPTHQGRRGDPQPGGQLASRTHGDSGD
jgi:hypothetical protein